MARRYTTSVGSSNRTTGALSGNKITKMGLGASTAVFRQNAPMNPTTDRNSLAKAWQIEAYRQVNICGEARYAVTLFSNIAGRAEIGISKPQALASKAVWVTEGPEVKALAEITPTVRDRTRLIRQFMLHWVIAGETYLVARPRLDSDPAGPDKTIWEFVGVHEIRRNGTQWQVVHENGNWINLSEDDPIIRIWNADPGQRMEAWSPIRSVLPTLREIEWLTRHIFAQVKSRLMSAGVWFLPNNLTFPPPPPDAINGDYEEALASMNEAEQFMVSLAASSTALLDDDEVSFPSIVMADPEALDTVDQKKLIQFWSEIDDKAMLLRSDAVRRFSLGMDMPPEQILGSSGVAVTGAGGSAGSSNHWSVWANEEQTISAHIEPALSELVSALTNSYLANAVPGGTTNVIAFNTASLRLRQDRSKEALELWDRGLLKGEVALREIGFDPENDAMDSGEFREWLLRKIASGSATPEQMQAAAALLGVVLPQTALSPAVSGNPSPQIPGTGQPPSLDGHPVQGPPQVQHDHTPAPYRLIHASEGLVLRALEKSGNRLLNDGKRGRDKDRATPAHMAHCVFEPTGGNSFDFSMADVVFSDLPPERSREIVTVLSDFCATLYATRQPYSREALAEVLSTVVN